MICKICGVNETDNPDGTTQCRCVAEFRMSCSKFLDIAKEINKRVKDIEMGRREMVMFG